MIVKARIEHQKDFLFMEEIPDKYVPDHRLSEKSITIKDAPVGIKNYQLSTNGLFLVHSEMKFDGPARILTEVEGEAITCQFIFSNTFPVLRIRTSQFADLHWFVQWEKTRKI